VKKNLLPFPTSLSTHILPPCSSTNFFAKVEDAAYQNPKSEYRKPKQIRVEIKPKSGNSKNSNPISALLEFVIVAII
jgi:hypothetical protein